MIPIPNSKRVAKARSKEAVGAALLSLAILVLNATGHCHLIALEELELAPDHWSRFDEF